MKYIDLIKMSKDALDAVKAPFVEKKNKLRLETELNEIESQIADAEAAIQEEKSSKEVDWKKVRVAIDKKAILDRELKQMQELKEELF